MFILTLGFISGGKAHAATLSVTPSSACTLSDAIEATNSDSAYGSCPAGSGSDTISLAAGTYTLSGDLPYISNPDVSIVGAGRDSTVIDGVDLYRIFQASGSGPEFLVSDLSVTRNGASGIAAIGTSGSGTIDLVTISNVRSYNNTNSTSRGGMSLFSSTSNLSILNTEVDHNSSAVDQNGVGIMIGAGGTGTIDLRGIDIHDNNTTSTANAIVGLLVADNGLHQVRFHSSAVYNNTSDFGGAVEFVAGNMGSGNSSVDIANITVTNNHSAELAGMILYGTNDSPSFKVTNVTIADNITTVGSLANAAGITFGAASGTPTLDMANTILSNNTVNGSPGNCLLSGAFGMPFNSLGGNLSSDNTCTGALTTAKDQNNLSTLNSTLGALSDNGGHALTIPLLQGSPAIDAGINISGLTTDARLAVRPQGTAFDSGAYESSFSKSSSTSTLAETGQNSLLFLSIGLLLATASSTVVIQKFRQD